MENMEAIAYSHLQDVDCGYASVHFSRYCTTEALPSIDKGLCAIGPPGLWVCTKAQALITKSNGERTPAE